MYNKLIMIIKNKKAQFNYNLYDRFEAGISLTGAEVKSIKTGGADLSNSYVKIIGNEIYLINANIPVEGKKDYSPTRSRKLLMHAKEILSLATISKARKLTLVPTKMYNKGRIFKVEVALAKAKKKFEKKESIKKKDIEREMEKELSTKY